MGGNPQTFARRSMVPGMNHCAGGPASSTFDALTPIVTWVENGVPPASVIGTAPSATPWPGRPGRRAHSRRMQTTMRRATPTAQATSPASDANCGDARRIASSIFAAGCFRPSKVRVGLSIDDRSGRFLAYCFPAGRGQFLVQLRVTRTLSRLTKWMNRASAFE